MENRKLLGINGLGRIGKLTLWNHLSLGYFDGFVVNIGRKVGRCLEDLLQTIESDSTYGSLERFLYGLSSQKCEIKIIDREQNLVKINGKKVKFLLEERNPLHIPWAEEGVRLVVDCTGVFLDPTVLADNAKGSVRGHLEAGAEKVICSAPFKIKDNSMSLPGDSKLFVFGVNHQEYDPGQHNILSAASCTTTGLAHMMMPLLETKATSRIVTASMSTIHAATSTQSILDSVPDAGTKDLRKNRSIMNNIILTSTGAAKALEQILPQIRQIGFMADSVRIPTSTVSLISLNVTFHEYKNELNEPEITRELLNGIYKEAAEGKQKGILIYSEQQNVSSSLIGMRAAAVIEANDTHTRTGFLSLPEGFLQQCGVNDPPEITMPVTHARIFGWYDNEFGSYVNMLGKLTTHVFENL
ncbi:MAG: glyceraldehyde-3-phosphate dehydrogenase [Candidatus Cloacimonetes bacterium]|nr:glyceraldehyde-3-phosphate dehydrogenase [Candidatus Cloacimonadota bacterium]